MANNGQHSAKGLEFKDVCVDISEKRILWDVSGHAHCGAVLAVMGPSGSGKTTLLNGLSGQTNVSSGRVLLNGRPLTKKMRRRVSYVLQEDIFFPNLTLRETLRYSALLRLPRELSFKEKLAKVEDIIKVLHLQECANTRIGNALVRGLSGGEKKRTSIACEMLTDPVMLLLDEPTSGLDSSSALSLMHTLCAVARSSHKIIVASIHQPSSQLYHMFDNLLLLAKGKVAYFGASSSVISYFSSRGLHCTLHYNPADFIVEMVSQEDSRRALIGDDPKQTTPSRRHWKWWQRLVRWRRQSDMYSTNEGAESKGMELEQYASSPRFPRKSSSAVVLQSSSTVLSEDDQDVVDVEGVVPVIVEGRSQVGNGMACHYNDEIKLDDEVSNVSGRVSSDEFAVRKWPTAWWWQWCVLTVRTFRQSRHVILSRLNCVQVLLMSVLVSLVWFQLPMDERSIRDREGFLFFLIIYTNFFAFITATFSFPSEHAVIAKERRSGSYHLSAYYLAKTVSELPLVVVLPFFFFTISYWAANINSFATYFALLLIITISNVVGQGFGLLLGALFMNLQKSLVAATLVLLGMLLLGGFYVERFPSWLRWARYTSYLSYAYDAAQYWGYWNLQFSCDLDEPLSVYEVCSNITGGTANITGGVANITGGVVNITTPLISSEEILNQLGAIGLPWYWDLLVVVGFGIVLRIGAYLCLRFLHTKR